MTSTTTRDRSVHSSTRLLASIAGLALVLAPADFGGGRAALGQNALGDGTALDANQRSGSSGRNTQVRDFGQEIALRNAIVTGNAAGGKSFRGTVGYSAVDDFRAQLGSNDTFRFQRDSVYSGLATQNLRGLGSLQFQLDQATGGQTQIGGGGLIVQRSGTSNLSASVQPGAPAPTTLDPFGNLKGSMRSTTDYFLESARQPRVLSASQDNNQLLTASPLQGIKSLSLHNSIFARDELLNPTADRFALAAPSFGEEAMPVVKKRKAAEAEGAEEPRPGEARPLGEMVGPASPMDSLVENLRENASNNLSKTVLDLEAEAERGAGEAVPGDATGDDSSRDPFTRMLEELRRDLNPSLDSGDKSKDPNRWKLGKDEPSDSKDKDKDRDQDDDEAGDKEQKTGGLTKPGEEAKDKQGADKGPEKPETIEEKAQRLLGGAQPKLESLLQQEGAKDLYSLHMARGQDSLNNERWFDAEERFSAALRAQPGDAMAAAGRVSAQIGAGMYLSAATNLRNTLRAYPELIPARFDARLFPQGDRLKAIRDQLLQRSELDTPVARDAGLLLAFIGHQIGNIDDVRSGFAVMGRVDQATGNAPDDLDRVLRSVWLK